MKVNFIGGGRLKASYQELLGKVEYLQLRENPLLLANLSQTNEVAYIINKRGFGQEYLVVKQHNPFKAQEWVKSSKIPEFLINQYENFIELQQDPDY